MTIVNGRRFWYRRARAVAVGAAAVVALSLAFPTAASAAPPTSGTYSGTAGDSTSDISFTISSSGVLSDFTGTSYCYSYSSGLLLPVLWKEGPSITVTADKPFSHVWEMYDHGVRYKLTGVVHADGTASGTMDAHYTYGVDVPEKDRIFCVGTSREWTASLGSDGGDDGSSECHPFPDVTAANQHCANIEWLKGQNITKPADGKFHPKSSVTRGSMTAFLYRLLYPGKPSPQCTSKPFTDVSTSNVFCGYITWAKKNKIAFGYENGTFGPDRAVTRGAMAAFLNRILTDQPAKKCTAKPFDDVAINSTFCGVITWMKSTGITYGVGGNKYGTEQPVTRQAMASFLKRAVEYHPQ